MADELMLSIDKAMEKLNKLIDNTIITAVTRDFCGYVERDAKKLCPVDDGELRGSIEYEIKESDSVVTALIGTNKEYAPYVEIGTGLYSSKGDGRKGGWMIPIGDDFTEADAAKYGYRVYTFKDGTKGCFTLGQHPHPFLAPALMQNKNKFAKIFDNKLKEAIRNG